MTAADLIRVLLDLDQQCLTSRPSPLGDAAKLVRLLCAHCEPSVRKIDLGDWRAVDVSPADRPAPRELSQATLGLVEQLTEANEEIDRLRAAADAGHELSMWAAAINWDGCPNEGEWLAGLRDRIEATQAAYREATS